MMLTWILGNMLLYHAGESWVSYVAWGVAYVVCSIFDTIAKNA